MIKEYALIVEFQGFFLTKYLYVNCEVKLIKTIYCSRFLSQKHVAPVL